MNTQRLIDSLDRFGRFLPGVVGDWPSEDVRWRPADGAWSVVEIVAHLRDEEVEDFRTRVKSTLADPTEPWPPIDPEGWAKERNYVNQDLATCLAAFVERRRESVTWLRGLDRPDWSRAYQHPKFGAIHAGDVMVSWVAHDALHLRQIAKRVFQIAQRDGGEFSTDYAGTWRA